MLPLATFAQSADEEINIAGFRFLDYNNKLPDNLLSSKTAVLVSVPPKSPRTTERGDWKSFSESAHSQFRKMGIDAVAYYFVDDIKSGNDPAIHFADELQKRQVQNILLLSRVPLKVAGKVTERYVVVITPFNGEASFISNGQPAWKTQGKELDKVLKTLGREVYRSKQPKTNFLIPDLPEFFEDAEIIKGRRIPTYAGDLKVDKLAVPQFKPALIPDQRPGGTINNKVEKEILAHNQEVTRNNSRLANIMKSYPLKYEITNTDSDKELYDQGFQYVLVRLNTTGVNIKKMLDYEINPAEADYTTVKNRDGKTTLRSIPKNAPVYKYYVKHLYTGDVYIGSKWDADETWEEALQNFIAKMKEELKLK